MLDNGLIQYYRDFAEHGMLHTRCIPNLEMLAEKKDDCKTFNKYKDKTNGTIFFEKTTGFKKAIDAEVLLSQLYPKLGIPSAIYLPTFNEGICQQGVVSNNVGNNNAKNGCDNYKLLKHLGFGCTKEEAEGYFSRDCIKQIAVMQALDCATHNWDRSVHNFFVRLSNDCRAEEVVLIDHEIGGATFDNSFKYNYHGYFGKDYQNSRMGLIQDLKCNQVALSVVSPHELAETVGRGIDLIPQTAEDIKQTIGYEVDPKYVSALQKSFEETAEDLAK